MTGHLFLACAILIPVALSFMVANKIDGVRLGIMLGLFGLLFLSLLSLLNEAIPFTTDAWDDRDYYRASLVQFSRIGDWIDFDQFSRTHEQRGYPLLLAWVHQLCGDSLFHRKALNASFFLLLALVWFAIGDVVGGRRLAFACALAILVSTPLWFYWIFLRKDMVIVLLQSLFLLGIINYMLAGRRRHGYFLIAIATLLVIPFRSQLALVNIAFLALATFLNTDSRNRLSGTTSKVLLSGALIALVLLLTTNPEILRSLGAEGALRTADLESVQTKIDEHASARTWGPVKFIFLYFLGELSGFHLTAWKELDAAFLRAISFLPWFYLGLPLFFIGLIQVARNTSLSAPRPLLLAIIAFAFLYAGVSWLSADTVRWRMPGFPAMAAIAAFGWTNTPAPRRFALLIGWGVLSSFSLLGYYAFK